MAITPQTNLYLLKCPLEEDNKNQIKFASSQAQLTYFSELPHLVVTNFTYQRKDSIIRYPAHIDSILNYNYVMYQNEAYTNKWFFAFITNMRYINDNMTEITIKTDVYQTWQFDLDFKASFVEREHVNNDTIGLHTVDEDLETGDYIVNTINKLNGLTAYKIILGTTVDYYFDTNNVFHIGGNNGGGVYGGVKSAYKYFYFDPNPNISKLSQVIEGFANAGKSDAIGMLFMCPTFLIPKQDDTVIDDGGVLEGTNPQSYWWDHFSGDNYPKKLNSLNGYTPKNKKLLTFPYCYMLMTNNNGGNARYKYELFDSSPADDGDCIFQVKSVLTPSMSVELVPYFYNNVNNLNYSEALTGAKYPICGWDTDVYTNWLTQNGVNIGVQLASASLQIAGGVGASLTGGGATLGASQIAGGSLQIANTIGTLRQHYLMSPQAEGNTNSGDVMFATNNSTFTAYGMSIKEENAKIIDDYFSMYGYKVNSLKVPNLTGRRNWNYIQTIGANIEGNIPQNDINELKNIFNSGITLWHNTNTYLDYSQNNDII